jgi:hypothetical protein
MGANLDNAALPGVYLAVVMGTACRVPYRGVGSRQEVPG